MSTSVAVVIGAGGMGQAIARRLGAGRRVVLADFDEQLLDAEASRMRAEGYEVTSVPVDVSRRDSVAGLVEHADSLGDITSVVDTAGLSPGQAPVPAILAVDLVGVALVLDEFGKVIAPAGAGVVIASVAGHSHPPFTAEQTLLLATTPPEELLELPFAAPSAFSHGGPAYAFAKRANIVRVQAASSSWGARGARVNSVSPGVVATPMGQAELNGEAGDFMRTMISASNAGRVGTSADIAAAVEFLLGPAASFISGSDLLVDGGVTAAVQTGGISLG